jgi:transcriptional regulator GlxA family with amidase domain
VLRRSGCGCTSRSPGQPATTHWALAGQLAERYPKIDVRAEPLYIDDGDVLTAGGGAAGMDLGLHLLRAQYRLVGTVPAAYRATFGVA